MRKVVAVDESQSPWPEWVEEEEPQLGNGFGRVPSCKSLSATEEDVKAFFTLAWAEQECYSFMDLGCATGAFALAAARFGMTKDTCLYEVDRRFGPLLWERKETWPHPCLTVMCDVITNHKLVIEKMKEKPWVVLCNCADWPTRGNLQTIAKLHKFVEALPSGSTFVCSIDLKGKSRSRPAFSDSVHVHREHLNFTHGAKKIDFWFYHKL
jgi:hypothetical protein